MFTSQLSETLSLTETAALVSVNPKTIQRWVQAKRFVKPLNEPGMKWRFRKIDVQAWLLAIGDVESALRELMTALDKISHDDESSVAERRWAAQRLAELRKCDPVALRAIEAMVRG